MAGRGSKLVERFENTAVTLEAQQAKLEKAIKDLKPSFWQSTLSETIKSVVLIAATWGAVLLTAKLATDNAHRTSLATAAATKEVASAADVKVRMTEAVEAFRGYFGSIAHDPNAQITVDLKSKADGLRDAVYSSMLPPPQQEAVSDLYSVCINSFGQITNEADLEKRRKMANDAIAQVTKKRQKADQSIDSWLFSKK